MALTSILTAGSSRIFLGCSDGIYLSSLNLETGELAPAHLLTLAKNPSFLAINASGNILYSVLENDGHVASWTVKQNGSLSSLNSRSTGGSGPCHVSLSPSERVLLVANYIGGSIASFPIEQDGSIGACASFYQFTGTGPNLERQKGPHAHGIFCDPSGHSIYVTDLGTDKVWVFTLDSKTGVLTKNEPAFANLTPGSGPRHLTFSADGKCIYVNGELDLSISTLTIDPASSGLRLVCSIPTFPKNISLKGNTDTAEIVLHHNEKWLYVSTRGTSSISVFAITENGELSFLHNTFLSVDGPRHFSISPDGKWMIVAGQNSNSITVLAIDPITGYLHSTGHSIVSKSPMCVIFAP